jgi:hypothetical protein
LFLYFIGVKINVTAALILFFYEQQNTFTYQTIFFVVSPKACNKQERLQVVKS